MIKASAGNNECSLPLASLAYQLFAQTSSAAWEIDDDCHVINMYLQCRGSLRSLRQDARLSKTPPGKLDETVITSLLIGIHAAATIEVLTFARSLGLNLDVVRAVVNDAAGCSVMLAKFTHSSWENPRFHSRLLSQRLLS